MTLPSSGVISLVDIATEFSAPFPAALTDFYRGGAFVPNTAPNAGVPTSGVIAVTDFYGASDAFSVNLFAGLNANPQLEFWNTTSWVKSSGFINPPGTSCLSANFNSDDSLIALGIDASPFIQVYNTSTWIAEPAVDIPPTGATNRAIRFTPDGQYLITTSQNDGFVYETTGWTRVATLASWWTGTVWDSAISPDGTLFASVAPVVSPYLRVWDVGTWTLHSTQPTGTSNSRGCDFHPNGNFLAVASELNEVRIFNVPSWTSFTLSGKSGTSAYACRFSHSGAYLAVAYFNNNTVIDIYETSGWTKIASTSPAIDATAGTPKLSWSADDAYLALGRFTASVGNTFMKVYETAGWTLTSNIVLANDASAQVFDLTFSNT